MGWFKRIFQMEEETEDSPEEMVEESVDINDLPSWVDERSNTGFEIIKPKIEAELEKLFDEKKTLLHNLEALKAAELHNPNISEREKSLMEGNRNAYISQHRQFINFLSVSDDLTCRETAQFCNNFEELLVKLAKSTAKGHMVMNEFFANHASKINRNIKSMSDSIGRVKEMLDDGDVGVEMLGDVQKAVSELRSKVKLLSELDTELAVLKKKLANSNFMKDKLLKSREELKQTKEYGEFRSASEEKETLRSSIKQVEDEVEAMFSPLQRAMRKYERMVVEDSDLFNDYMDSAVNGLSKDEGLKIISILGRMKAALESGSLELKDSDKAVQRLSEIKGDRLSGLRSRYVDARSDIRRIEEKMRYNNALQDLDDLQYKVEHVENQIKILEEKIDKAEQTRQKIDLEKLRVAVQGRIRDAFSSEVIITWKERDSQSA